MSGPLVPVAEGRGTYGRGVTAGGTSAGAGVEGGATAEGATGDGVTGGGATGGGTTAGEGATEHPMTVLSIPRPRHITRRRVTIGRPPFRREYPVIQVISAIPIMSKTCAMLPREFCTHDGLYRACPWRAWVIRETGDATSLDPEGNRAQACSHGVLLPIATQEGCVRLLRAHLHSHYAPFNH